MGCFDFTYADNGSNIRGNKGYFYLTQKLCEICRLPCPLQFDYLNEYGDITINSMVDSVAIDIYALYAAEIYLEYKGNKEFDYFNNKKFQWLELFIYKLRNRSFDSNFQSVMDEIRNIGIHYFYYKNDSYKELVCRKKLIRIPAISNQKEKELMSQGTFIMHIPLLFSKKKLPQKKGDYLLEVARNWGFVSDSDPNQGFSPTKNHYMVYQPVL